MARKLRDRPIVIASKIPPKRPGLAAFAEIAKRSKDFRPAREVLRVVRAVPTVFPQVDHGTRIGGWPIERVTVIHGESSHGKTVFAHGLGFSFLKRNHIYALVDAEMTTPITWCESLLGEYADANTFIAMRPRSYEAAVDGVRRKANEIANLRSQGKVPKDTTALFVIDSVRKLVPENIMDRIKKMGAVGAKGSVDGFGGRAAMLRAGLNAAWMDELVPLMHDTQCAILFIARESEDPNASANDRKFGGGWKMGGGKSLEFEPSIIARVQRDKFHYIGRDREKGERGTMVGERHLVEIRKTKVSAKTDRTIYTYFNTSNGAITPEGFDRARDVFELARQFDVVKGAGSWFTWGRKRWQGEVRALKALYADSELLQELEAEVRGKFGEIAPTEVTEDGEVVA